MRLGTASAAWRWHNTSCLPGQDRRQSFISHLHVGADVKIILITNIYITYIGSSFRMQKFRFELEANKKTMCLQSFLSFPFPLLDRDFTFYLKIIILCLGRWMAEWDATTWEWDSCMLTSSAVSNLFHNVFSTFIQSNNNNCYCYYW